MRPALGLLLLLLVAACGGRGSAPAFNLEQAEALAGRALLRPDEVSGGGWTALASGFGEPALSGSAACGPLQRFEQELIGAARGKAARAFQRPSQGGAFPMQVLQYVYVYESDEQAQGMVERFRELADFADCISFGLGAGTQRTTTSEVSVAAEGPRAAAVRAYETARGDGQRIRTAFIVWQEGNAVGWLSILGPASAISGTFTSAVVSSAGAALRETAQGRRGTTAAASPAPA